ncbi:MAG: hypothetical protein KAZ30_04485 [Candidatus Magasanikbacteria bacterium]|nr:hypothetical protein [Candidatus Magasanikbacteria bacterium]
MNLFFKNSLQWIGAIFFWIVGLFFVYVYGTIQLLSSIEWDSPYSSYFFVSPWSIMILVGILSLFPLKLLPLRKWNSGLALTALFLLVGPALSTQFIIQVFIFLASIPFLGPIFEPLFTTKYSVGILLGLVFWGLYGFGYKIVWNIFKTKYFQPVITK